MGYTTRVIISTA